MSFILGRKKYWAVWLVKEQETYALLKRKKFNPTDKALRFKKGKTKEIDASKPTYSRGLNLYYFIEVEHGQLFFKGDKGANTNPELLDMILKQSIVRQLTANLHEKAFGGQILSLIMALLMGGLIGFIIGGFIL